MALCKAITLEFKKKRIRNYYYKRMWLLQLVVGDRAPESQTKPF